VPTRAMCPAQLDTRFGRHRILPGPPHLGRCRLLVTARAWLARSPLLGAHERALWRCQVRHLYPSGMGGPGSLMKLSTHLDAHGHDEVIKPRPLAEAMPGGYSVDDVAVKDPTEETPGSVTCPAGHTVTISAKGRASFARYCRTCPLRDRSYPLQARAGDDLRAQSLLCQGPACTVCQRGDQSRLQGHSSKRRAYPCQMKRKLNGAKLRYRGVAKHAMHSLLLGAVWSLKVLLCHNLTRSTDTGCSHATTTPLSHLSTRRDARGEERGTAHPEDPQGALPGWRQWGWCSRLLGPRGSSRYPTPTIGT